MWAWSSVKLTCVSSERGRWDDRFVFAQVRALPHVVFKRALGFVRVQSAGVILRVEAVVGRDSLEAVEGRLTAPRLRESVAALETVDALKRVLTTQFT